MAEIELEVKVQLLAEDFAQYNHEWFRLRLSEWLKRYRGGIMLYGFLVLFLLALLFLFGEPQDAMEKASHWTKADTEFTIFLVLFFAIILGFVRYYIKNIRTVSQRFYDSNKMMQAERVYQFNDKGFEIRSVNGFVTVGWDKVHRVVAFTGQYAIFIATTQSYLIPKHCFTKPGQEEKFRELVATYFPGGID